MLRVGVIGCGLMGRMHSLNCNQTEDVSVVAVADVRTDRAKALAEELNATAYIKAETMFEDTRLDAVVLASPPFTRWPALRSATSLGIAVFAEKPVALDLCTAKACCFAVQKSSILNGVGFQLRYSPLTQYARTLVTGRTVTHVRTACTTSYYLTADVPPWYLQREYSGGPLVEQAIHVIDAARYLVGDITHVFAQGNRPVDAGADPMDSEDSTVMVYRFANGALGSHMDSCAMVEFNWEVELFGPDWRLLVDYARGIVRGNIEKQHIWLESRGVDLHELEIRTFLANVHEDNTNIVLSDFEDASKTLAVALAGDRSLHTSAWEPVLL